MPTNRPILLASRPTAMVLALSLVAGLSAPFVWFSQAGAADDPPPACSVANHNGCIELSPTPPQNTVAAPPNIVLMLDDSGSMEWDYMPDWQYLKNRSQYKGLQDSNVNGLWYNPAVTYTPPPRADGTSYPDSQGITHALRDPFSGSTATWDLRYHSTSIRYYQWLDGGYTDGTKFAASLVCDNNYEFDGTICNYTGSWSPPAPRPQQLYCAQSGYSLDNSTNPPRCIRKDNTGEVVIVTEGDPPRLRCPSGYPNYNSSDQLCYSNASAPPATKNPHYACIEPAGFPNANVYDGSTHMCWRRDNTNYLSFPYVTGDPYDSDNPTPFQVHYVASAGDCAKVVNAGQKAACIDDDDTSGVAAPPGIEAGRNIANWYSYYHTRIRMAKTSLMFAFDQLDPKYRFGFASINGQGKARITGPVSASSAAYAVPYSASSVPYVTFDDEITMTDVNGNAVRIGGDPENRLAVVQPFGEGSDPNSQRTKFWKWIAALGVADITPLRQSLQAVGKYYQTDQPWLMMPGDPGYVERSTHKYTCRRAYTILATDGFWNGNAPSAIGNADGADGTIYNGSTGQAYGYTAKQPFSDDESDTLADVAMYYWKTDLQPGIPNEVANSTADPAFWQHMTTFTIGMGFAPTGITPDSATPGTIIAWSRGGAEVGGTSDPFGWPVPAVNLATRVGSENNVADLLHAAVDGHGNFFSASNPKQLADSFSKVLTQISAQNVLPTAAATNTSVIGIGALAFSTGYSTGDWSGSFEASPLNADGTVGSTDAWDAGAQLNTTYHASYSGAHAARKVYTSVYTVVPASGSTAGTASFDKGLDFTAANAASLDIVETAGLESPALKGGDDTLAHRIDYLLGDSQYEGTTYRTRSSILGAILRSQPVYVSAPNGGYYSLWPSGSPEAATGAQSYDTFIADNDDREGTVYVGANDGMLHAFKAPAPTCTSPTSCTYGAGGEERWAFIPRAVYANLGNLTDNAHFSFRPTVDATPVTRDVYFSQGSPAHQEWHTVLVGSVGLGGRGVYALDITDPTSFSASNVLWEFDSDMTMDSGCVASYGDCKASDLGYTLSEPNIGRIKYGNKWVVLVPNGYFPDCTTPDIPTADRAGCEAIAADVPKDSNDKPYSALFVLDAETGEVLAELKTPTNISGVTSFGLASAVLGDYNSDQIDDVAFAGDAEGNLWRFDLSSTNRAQWTVTLAYKGVNDGTHQGLQPITVMPRLFPDPTTNRFMVVFGTGKYLGVGDNVVARDADDKFVRQAVYGIRDQGPSATSATAYNQSDLVPQYLHEMLAPDQLANGDANPNAGASLRCVTGDASDTCDSATATPTSSVPANKGGWFIELYTATSGGVQNNSGERVVARPGAIFASNTVVLQSLITGGNNADACNPSVSGAVMFIDAATGGPGQGLSSLGGPPTVGARVDNARTSGSLPLVSALGGGRAYIPGTSLTGASGAGPLTGDLPIWRRRSWHQINPNG